MTKYSAAQRMGPNSAVVKRVSSVLPPLLGGTGDDLAALSAALLGTSRVGTGTIWGAVASDEYRTRSLGLY
jgi:hypothetical protein